MYELIEVDLAGNSYTIGTHESFGHICAQTALFKRARPRYVYLIVNPDRMDNRCPSGLTEEEQELLP